MSTSKKILFVIMLGLLSAPVGLAYELECVAGCGEGAHGGPAEVAKLIEPFGVDFDKQGNLYICEYQGQMVTKVDPQGIITLFAGNGRKGYGGDNGPARTAEFNDPHSHYIRGDQLFVADTRNHLVRKIDLRTQTITTIAGTGESGYSGDGGPAVRAKFNGIYDIALDRNAETMYAADLRNRRVRRVDLKTGVVTTVAGNGQQGVPRDGAEAVKSPLVDPRAVEVDSQGRLYILSRGGNALRRVDTNGRITTVIKPGQLPFDMKGPKHLTMDLEGNVVIADTENHVIRRYFPKTGKVENIAGTGEKGDVLREHDPFVTQFNRPHGVYVHPSGALYVSDSYNHRVVKLTNW